MQEITHYIKNIPLQMEDTKAPMRKNIFIEFSFKLGRCVDIKELEQCKVELAGIIREELQQEMWNKLYGDIRTELKQMRRKLFPLSIEEDGPITDCIKQIDNLLGKKITEED